MSLHLPSSKKEVSYHHTCFRFCWQRCFDFVIKQRYTSDSFQIRTLKEEILFDTVIRLGKGFRQNNQMDLTWAYKIFIELVELYL